MTLYSSEYNKKANAFNEGIAMIRNRNNRFFLNAKRNNSIYDLTDIKSYFNVYEIGGKQELVFRNNSDLPETIKKDIETLFKSTWDL